MSKRKKKLEFDCEENFGKFHVRPCGRPCELVAPRMRGKGQFSNNAALWLSLSQFVLRLRDDTRFVRVSRVRRTIERTTRREKNAFHLLSRRR